MKQAEPRPGGTRIYSDEQFNEALTSAAEWIGVCLKDRHTDFTPTLLVHAKIHGEDEWGMTMVAMPNFDMNKRHELLESVGAMFGKKSELVGAIFLVTEAWISVGNSDGSRKYALPEQDPDRKEAVLASGLTYDGRSAMARVIVTRNKRNQMVPGERELLPYGGDVKVENNVCKAFWRGYVLAAMEGMAKRNA